MLIPIPNLSPIRIQRQVRQIWFQILHIQIQTSQRFRIHPIHRVQRRASTIILIQITIPSPTKLTTRQVTTESKVVPMIAT
jgi:hypothetical protein